MRSLLGLYQGFPCLGLTLHLLFNDELDFNFFPGSICALLCVALRCWYEGGGFFCVFYDES